jgi:hypothetical protein
VSRPLVIVGARAAQAPTRRVKSRRRPRCAPPAWSTISAGMASISRIAVTSRAFAGVSIRHIRAP